MDLFIVLFDNKKRIDHMITFTRTTIVSVILNSLFFFKKNSEPTKCTS